MPCQCHPCDQKQQIVNLDISLGCGVPGLKADVANFAVCQ
jgi:hypothetical protein